MKHNQSP